MNILIFNWRDLKHSWAGGGEIYVFELAKRWVQAGHSVTVFCGQDVDGKLPETEKYDGISIIRRGGRFSLYFWAFWFYVFQRKEKYDIAIDVQNGIPFFTPLFVFIPKFSFVFHVHGKQFFYELPFGISHIGYLIEKYLFPLLYNDLHVVTISETTKEDLVAIGFKKKNIHIVYCGINEKKRKSKKSKKFSSPTILYLGRIKSYKRVDLLISLLPAILKKVPKAKLIIAGWGTEASSVTNMVMKSPWRKKIRLVGPVSEKEKNELLSRSWIFINPSIGEGWSISVVEANLHATPAIAFRVPGLSESIKDKKTGFLVEDTDELVSSTIKALKNEKLRKKLSKSAYLWAKSFSWDTAAKESMNLFSHYVRRQK